MSNALAIALIGVGVLVIYAGSTGRISQVWSAFQATGVGGEGSALTDLQNPHINVYRSGRSYGTTVGTLNLSDEGQY